MLFVHLVNIICAEYIHIYFYFAPDSKCWKISLEDTKYTPMLLGRYLFLFIFTQLVCVKPSNIVVLQEVAPYRVCVLRHWSGGNFNVYLPVPPAAKLFAIIKLRVQYFDFFEGQGRKSKHCEEGPHSICCLFNVFIW